MNICLFTNEEINKPLSANDERAIHLNKVLHKKEGDTFSAGIIGGQAGTATITKAVEVPNPKTGKNDVQYEFSFKEESDGKPLFPLIMIIGFPRPIQLKRLLRDVAALGVCEVHLTGTELGEKSYMQSTLVERGAAYQMLLDGTVQAASTHVPELFLHSTLKECLDSIESQENQQAAENLEASSNQQAAENREASSNQQCGHLEKITLDNICPEGSLETLVSGIGKLSENQKVVAAIGSERGWTDKERQLLRDSGFKICSMGSRVMRTETAATVSASIILSKLGYLD